MTKKKKKLNILLIVAAVIVAGIAAVAVWQWDNILSVIYSVKYSEEDLNRMLDENKSELNTALEGIGANTVRDLTEEETAALEEGLITENDAVEISLGIKTLQEKLAEKNEQKSTPAQSTSSDETSATSDLIAQLYVLKSSYMGKLSSLESQAKAEYSSTPENERTAAWKSSMLAKYSGKVAALEGECDARVEALISEIKAELSKTGGDMSIINTIRSAYENEKQIKKAHYLNTYMK